MFLGSPNGSFKITALPKPAAVHYSGVIVSGPGLVLDDQIAWLSSGQLVYPVQEHEGLSSWANLWDVHVNTRTGLPASTPGRITTWAEGHLTDTNGTSDGKQLAVTKDSGQADIYVGELEAGGRRLKNPRRLTVEESDEFPGTWTPDNKAVLCWSNRNATSGIYKQALDQTAAQTVVIGPDFKDWPVVSPDSSWILYLSGADPNRGPNTPVRVMRVPALGGAPQMIFEGRGIDYLGCAHSPASNCVFSQQGPDQKQVIFSAIDPIKGRGQGLARVNLKQPATRYFWALSPDGSRLAFLQYDYYEEGRIQILPLAGGGARELDVKGWRGLMFLFWTADGRGLFVSAVSGTGATALYVDLEGRAQVVWQQESIMSGMPALGVPSPNGRYLALLGYTGGCNVWLLENF